MASVSKNIPYASRRAALLLLIVGGLMLAMAGRVAYLQTYGRDKTLASAERQQHQIETLYARRGTVYDSTGTLMAGTVQNTDLFVDAKFLADYYSSDDHDYTEYQRGIEKLANLIDKTPADLANLLSTKSDTRFLKVATKLDDGTVAAIKQLNLPGVGFTPSNERYYPMGSIAAHLLGGVGEDGHGLDGLELEFDKQLAGHNGWKRTLKDARRNPIAVDADDYRPAEHGQHLILTIDANIQMIAEQELAATCKEFHAETGEVVVMDPHTGDVLAMANYPTFNPQELDDSTKEARTNRVLVSPYEPGSTIKPFIAGPAFQWGITRPEEVINTGNGNYYTPYHRRMHDEHGGYPQLAMWDVLVKSSNVGMSILGERMGNPKIYQALHGFGFGKPTGIELPGESGGKLNPLAKWTKYSTESCATGYELMVTPLQLARAFSAYANGGRLPQPRLVKGFLDTSGNVVARRKPVDFDSLPQVIDSRTADEIRRILCDVVVRGTARVGVRSPTWNIFAKTGTAHISLGPGKGYSADLYNSSFMAGCPYEDPRIVVTFIIHKPHAKVYYGGEVAGPGAGRLIQRCMAYLQVPASPDLQLPPPNIQNVLWEFDPKQYNRSKVTLVHDESVTQETSHPRN